MSEDLEHLQNGREKEIYISCVLEEVIEHSPHPMKDIEYMTVSVRNEGGGC